MADNCFNNLRKNYIYLKTPPLKQGGVFLNTEKYYKNLTRRSATMFMILIMGLMAGPAVSL